MDLQRTTVRVPSVYLTPTGFVAGPTAVFVHWVLTRDNGDRHLLTPFPPVQCLRYQPSVN